EDGASASSNDNDQDEMSEPGCDNDQEGPNDGHGNGDVKAAKKTGDDDRQVTEGARGKDDDNGGEPGPSPRPSPKQKGRGGGARRRAPKPPPHATTKDEAGPCGGSGVPTGSSAVGILRAWSKALQVERSCSRERGVGTTGPPAWLIHRGSPSRLPCTLNRARQSHET